MHPCSCGNEVDGEGAVCARCKALQALGLEAGATTKDIENTYRVLVKVWHPDRFHADPKLKAAAEEKLKSINSAHAYLEADTAKTRPRRRAKAAARGPQPMSATAETLDASPAWPQPRRRARSRVLLNPLVASSLLIRFVVLLCGLGAVTLVLLGINSYLSTNPASARAYRAYRDDLVRGLEVQAARAVGSVGQSLHRASAASRPPAADSVAQTSGTDQLSAAGAPADQSDSPLPPPPHIPMPYVTAGFTKDEVMEVMGTPSSSTQDSLKYKQAVFYLKNGLVAGWRVDQTLIPLHVRLWPQGRVGPGVLTFTVGSTRDEVIAVQGTPTLFTEGKFGYGGSEVFFENGRVIGWKNDRASEQLRTAAP